MTLEKRLRAERIRTNSIHKQSVDVWSSHGPKSENSKPVMLRRYRTAKRQPVLRWGRYSNPKNTVRVVPNSKVIFNNAIVPKRITDEMRDLSIKEPRDGRRDNLYHEELQPFYFAAEALPNQAIDVLITRGILERRELPNWAKEEGVDRSRFEVEYRWLGYDVTPGSEYALNERAVESLRSRDTEFVIYDEVSKTLWDVCRGNRKALQRLRAIGCFTTSVLEGAIQGQNPVATHFGIGEDELTDVHYTLYNRRRDRIESHVKVRRKRDMRKRTRQRHEKHPYKLRQRAGIITDYVPPKSKSVAHKISKRPKTKMSVPERMRYLDDPRKLYAACSMITSRKAKSDHFMSPDPFLHDPFRIILGYVQSRTDRKLPVDVDELLSLNNEVLNTRLEKWEEREKVKIITVPHMFGNRFYVIDAAEDEVEVMEGEAHGDPLYLSSGYRRNPELYVTNHRELLRATRRVLDGYMEVSDFNKLDPRSKAILEYCEDLRETCGFAHNINPRDIASVRVPELRALLTSKSYGGVSLMDLHPTFTYPSVDGEARGRTPFRRRMKRRHLSPQNPVSEPSQVYPGKSLEPSISPMDRPNFPVRGPFRIGF